jgi:hypothetical protein
LRPLTENEASSGSLCRPALTQRMPETEGA